MRQTESHGGVSQFCGKCRRLLTTVAGTDQCLVCDAPKPGAGRRGPALPIKEPPKSFMTPKKPEAVGGKSSYAELEKLIENLPFPETDKQFKFVKAIKRALERYKANAK